MNPAERRLQLLRMGYDPIPCNGKRPVMEDWSSRDKTNPGEIGMWSSPGGFPFAQNTGIRTKFTPPIDIDIPIPEAADAAEQLVRDRFGEDGTAILVRFGRSPKRAITFRTETPFPKFTALLLAPNEPDGQRPDQRIEMLCDGQQIVVDGIHPDTKQHYGWQGGRSVGDIKREALPEISEAEARALVADIADLLVKEHGYRLVNAKGEPIADVPKGGANGHGQDGGAAPPLLRLGQRPEDPLRAPARRGARPGPRAASARSAAGEDLTARAIHVRY